MIFTHVPITLNRHEVIRYLGYKRNKSESSEQINDLIDKLINKAKYIIEPKGIIKTVNISSRNPDNWEIECDAGAFIIKGEKIYKHLENCELITLMAVTVGSDLDVQIDNLFQTEQPTEALIFDAIGSDAAERVADYVNQYVINEAKRKGYATRFRFSPGYSGWSVENQQSIIDYLCTGEIEISVTEYSQLMPRKSVSAVIGWLPMITGETTDNTTIETTGEITSKTTDKNTGKITGGELEAGAKCTRCDTSTCQFRQV